MAFRLVYMDYSSDRLEDDIRFYSETMGLKLDADSSADEAWLTLGYDHHNLRFRKAEAQTLDAVGYQLAKGIDLAEMESRLTKAGVKFSRKTDARPGIARLIEVESIGGHVIQLADEVGTRTGSLPNDGVAPLRLGHFAIASEQGDRIKAFYRDVLGFYNTDSFGDAVDFFACNHEHHVINIIHIPVSYRLNHLAFQLRDNSAQARAADILARDNKPILWGPTRHTAGHNVASYFRDESRRVVELYSDMDIYLADLDIMEPRPWHEETPMRPRKWDRGDLAYWKTKFIPELSQL